MLEGCCEIQLLADASVGGQKEELIEIGEAEEEEKVRSMWEALGKGSGGYFNESPLFQAAEMELEERNELERACADLKALWNC